MLTENSKKIVLKLGSSTVVDSKGAFKKKWITSLIKDIKKYLEPLAINEKTINGNRDIDIIPAEIVKSLYGIGLKPAIKII